MRFTERELTLLSDGVLTMISNAGEAKKLVTDAGAHKAIDKYTSELRSLNSVLCKVCPVSRHNLYDELCEILTEYEHPEEYNHRTGADDLYNMLVKIQDNWDSITAGD